jgi:hypothetical protein
MFARFVQSSPTFHQAHRVTVPAPHAPKTKRRSEARRLHHAFTWSLRSCRTRLLTARQSSLTRRGAAHSGDSVRMEANGGLARTGCKEEWDTSKPSKKGLCVPSGSLQFSMRSSVAVPRDPSNNVRPPWGKQKARGDRPGEWCTRFVSCLTFTGISMRGAEAREVPGKDVDLTPSPPHSTQSPGRDARRPNSRSRLNTSKRAHASEKFPRIVKLNSRLRTARPVAESRC